MVGRGGYAAPGYQALFPGEARPPPLKTDDVVRMTVEGVGTIENTIGDQRKGVTRVPARSKRAA